MRAQIKRVSGTMLGHVKAALLAVADILDLFASRRAKLPIEAAMEALRRRLAAQELTTVRDAIRTPGMPTPDDDEAWRDQNMIEADRVRRGEDPRTLDEAMPQRVAELDARSDEAREKLATAEDEASTTHAAVVDIEQREQHHIEENGTSVRLKEQVRWWKRLEVPVWFLEAVIIFLVMANYYGVMEAMSLSAVPMFVWGQVLGTSIPAVAATFALAMAVAWALPYDRKRKPHVAVAVVLMAVFLVFSLAVGSVRHVANLSAHSLDAATYAIGDTAVALVVTISAIVMASIAAMIRRNVRALAEELEVLLREESYFASEKVARGIADEAATARLTDIVHRVELPRRARTMFEAETLSCARRLDAAEVRVEEWVERSRSLYRELLTLSDVEVEAAQEAFEREATVSGLWSAVRLAAMVLVMLLPLAGAGCSGGARDSGPWTLIGCDPTGEAPNQVCSSAWLGQAVGEAADLLYDYPDAGLQVIMSAGSYADIEVFGPLQRRGRSSKNARADRSVWRRATVAWAASLPVRHDAEVDPKLNRSDLVSLLRIAGVEADIRKATHPTSTVTLRLGADGRLISHGFDAEERVPSADDLLAKVAGDDETAWDLASIDVAEVCGVVSRGLRADEHARLRDLVGELLTRGGVGDVTVGGPCMAGADLDGMWLGGEDTVHR